METESKLGNFGELPNIDDLASDNMSQIVPANTAIIIINPGANQAIVNLKGEITKLMEYTTSRVIKSDTDLTPATNDLTLISKLKKAVKGYQDEYVSPIKTHLDKVQFVFKDLLACLDIVEKDSKAKIQTYIDAQKARAAEAERLNREAAELARKQAEFSGTGEITVDTDTLFAPPPVRKVSTDLGTISTSKTWKWEIEDMSKIPVEYMTLDVVKIGKVVRAGLHNIPGLKIYSEDNLRITTK